MATHPKDNTMTDRGADVCVAANCVKLAIGPTKKGWCPFCRDCIQEMLMPVERPVTTVAADDPLRFQCPACGGYFKVASEYSERVFCSRHCAGLLVEAIRGGGSDA